MRKNKIIFLKIGLLLILFLILKPHQILAQQDQETISSASTVMDSLVLKARVDTLQNLNEKILDSIYWTLGVFVTIFLTLISVNLYFNIRGNRKEIQKVKDDFITTSRNEILASEAKILEKVSLLNEREFESIKSELLTTSRNEILASEAKILEKMNSTDRMRVVDLENNKYKINTLESIIEDLDVRIKEFEIEKFAKNKQQGAIMGMIDILGVSIDKKKYDIPERLSKIKDYLKDNDLRPQIALRLNKQLIKLESLPEYKTIVDEIKLSIRTFTD